MASSAYGIVTNKELYDLFPNKEVPYNNRCPTHSEIISMGISVDASYQSNQCVKYQDIIVINFDGCMRIYGSHPSSLSGQLRLYTNSSGTAYGYTGTWSGKPGSPTYNPVLLGPMKMYGGDIVEATWNTIYFEFTVGAPSGDAFTFIAYHGSVRGSTIASDVYSTTSSYSTGIKKVSDYWTYADYQNNGVGLWYTIS